MNDLLLLKEAYSNFKRQDFASALKIYSFLLEKGSCNSKTLYFFIKECERRLGCTSKLSKNADLKKLALKSNIQVDEIARVEQSKVFDEEFYNNVYGHCLSSGMTAAEDFCCSGWKARRDPNPFFSIARYLQYEDSVDISGEPVNPLIDYLDSDFDLVKAKHAGIFDYFEYVNHPLASLCFPAKVDFSLGVQQRLKILVVIHAYYPKRLKIILPSLKHIPYSIELVITVCSEGDKEIVQCYLEKVDLFIDAFDIRIVPNHGRDLLPFVRVIEDLNFQNKNYDYVLKLHSKKSKTRGKNTDFGDKWLSSILSNLLGASSNVQFILLKLLQTNDCALVASLTSVDVFRFCKWKTNREPIAHLVDVFHIKENLEDPIYFPAGSMFWVDFKSAVKIASCFEKSRVPREPLANNGTYLHSFERLIPYILRSTHKCVKFHCNLDLDRQKPIKFNSLLSYQKFDIWMSAFIRQMVQPMIANRSSQNWRFSTYRNPSMLCVVVGDHVELLMTTLISLYSLRALVDFQVIVYSSLLPLSEQQKILFLFPGIMFHSVCSDSDQIENFVRFLSQKNSSKIMLSPAGSILNPVEFDNALSMSSKNESLFYLLKSKGLQNLSMHDIALLAKQELLANYLKQFRTKLLEPHDLINHIYCDLLKSKNVKVFSCDKY